MIERKFVSQNIKEFRIKEFVAGQLNRVGLSDVKLQRTPLGEKIVVSASRPGLVVGRAGSNIQKLTRELKENFDLENPQIEIEEIKNMFLDPAIVAETIASTLERFGTKQFKGSGHKALRGVMDAGAMGVEILISGKIPSQRSKVWRFYEGYLKKCGDIAVSSVKVAYTTAHIKTGAVGIKVSIMPADTILPDRIEILKEPKVVVEEKDLEETSEEKAEEKPKKETKKPAKKTTKKTTKKKETKKTEETTQEKSEEKVVENEGAKEAKKKTEATQDAKQTEKKKEGEEQ